MERFDIRVGRVGLPSHWEFHGLLILLEDELKVVPSLDAEAEGDAF
jgi:hypothetical protein